MIAGYGTSGHAACLALPAPAFGTGRAGSALQGAGTTAAAVARSVRRPERGVALPFGSKCARAGLEMTCSDGGTGDGTPERVSVGSRA